MARITSKPRIRSLLRDEARYAVYHPVRAAQRHPHTSAGGIILVALAILGFVAIFPEIHRYIHIDRM